MNAEYVGHSADVHADGHLYLRRDLKVFEGFTSGGRIRYFPQHAIVREIHRDGVGPIEKLIWEGHPEGGMMKPLIEDYK